MDIIELIKNFEHAGFTRKQAETQVQTMVDFKKDLMTKNDGRELSARMDLLNEKVDSRFQSIQISLQTLHQRLDAQDAKINLSPLINTVYMSGILLLYLGFTKYAPIIEAWLSTYF